MRSVSKRDIPSDMESLIFQKLPVKSLLRVKSASKSHKEMIDSRYFIEEHYKNMKDRLLLRVPAYKPADVEAMLGALNNFTNYMKHVSTYALYDDEALTNFTMPDELQVPGDPDLWSVVGVSKGVMCMATHPLGRIVLLNPATRQMSKLPTYDSLLPGRQGHSRFVGVVFGFSLDDNRGFN